MPRSSSPSPSITAMKPHPQTLTPDATLAMTPDEENDLLQSIHLPHSLLPHSLLMDDDDDPDPSPHFHAPMSSLLFPTSDASDDDVAAPADLKPPLAFSPPPRIDPSPHISCQFYTFNSDSHALMVRCILEARPATPDEIRAATPTSVLASWRSVWKDRNEDTAYLTAWKRIQDKLHAHLDPTSSRGFLYFKTNPSQCVSHFEQWQDIVAEAHADPDLLRHLGLKETLDRIRQAWTVGAKFYGIPESFIRVCISSCQVCSSATGSSSSTSIAAAGRSKRRRFEYTESFEVPAREVPQRLQQLAYKHKVVLCIRQKYIRYKPFMAEVKDYACHRAGEPSSAKKAKALKREPYQSKRCGCSFRIRAIVPIANYSEKDKTFVYEEEGIAVFKLYAVHSGHEPGPLDGNARIIHRVVGQKGVLEVDPEVYGVREETENELAMMVLEQNTDAHRTVLHQVQELKAEAGLLEGKVAKMPLELLSTLSHELSDILQRLRRVGVTEHVEEPLVAGDDRVPRWADESNNYLDMHNRMFSKDADILEEEDTDFNSTLRTMIPWDRMPTECHDSKLLMAGRCKPDKWMMKEDCTDFDAKSVLKCGEDYEEAKLIKPLTHDGAMVGESSLGGMQVEGFYPDNAKWYDSPCGLDHSGDSGDDRFRH